MIDLLFRITLSNAGISFALAAVAAVVGKTLKHPALTHRLRKVTEVGGDELQVVWRARHHLRIHEEICRDDLVLSSLNPKPRTYADSLLNAIEYLSSPVIRPPAMACEISSSSRRRE